MNKIFENAWLFIAYPRKLPARLNYGLVLIITVTSISVIMDGLALALIVPLIDILIGTQDDTSSVSIIRWASDFLGWFGIETSTGWLISVIVVFQIVRAIGLALQVWLTTLFRADFERYLKNRSFDLLVRASWPYLTTLRSGTMINRVIAQSSRGGHTYSSFAIGISALLTAIVYLVASLIISWQLSLIAIAYSLALMVSLSYFFVLGKRLGARINANSEEVLNEISESVGSLKAVKSSALENSVIGRFTNATKKYARSDSLVGLQQGLMQSIFELVFLLAIVIGLFFATRTLDLTNSAILLFALLFFRIFQRLRGIQSELQSFYQLVPSLESIESLQNDARTHAERQTGSDVGRLESQIQLVDVGYEYVKGHPVLHEVSIEIKANTSVAIVGPSGVGKTTVVDMVVGLIDPISGTVEIDGRSLQEISLSSWRERIAYVPQGAVLFHDTVARNIALGVSDPKQEEIEDAARQAGADQFISNLPLGYSTVVGERGVTLSGGQRQRIALARALLRKPDLLILDEATSELDVNSEQRFQATLSELHGRTTMLIVAHRLSTVMGVDRVYVLEDGKVAEEGAPQELIASRGRFYAMLQQSGQVK